MTTRNEQVIQDAKPWEELERAANRLYYGMEEPPKEGEFGKSTPYRCVAVCASTDVIVAGVETRVVAGWGAGQFPTDKPDHVRVVISKLREMADDLEKALALADTEGPQVP